MFDRKLHLELIAIEIDALCGKLNELYVDKPEFIIFFNKFKDNIHKVQNQPSFEEAFITYEKILKIDQKKENTVSAITYKMMLTASLLVEFGLHIKFEKEEADNFSAITHLIGISRQIISNLEVRDELLRNKKPKGKSPKKEEAMRKSKEIALSLITNDINKKLRTAKLCELTYKKLQEDYLDQLPVESIGIKAWINSVFPEYVKKGGRQKK